MRVLLTILLCALLPLTAQSATDITAHERLCRAETHGAIGRWTPFHDRLLHMYAEEFLRHTEIRGATVVFCVSESPGATAWGMLLNTGSGQTFLVGVGRRFIRAMGTEMRPVIAHEVAHLTVDIRASEHAVDTIGVRWVGKSATISSLKETIRFLEYESAHQLITFGGVGDLKKRLVLLEGVSE